MDYAIEARDRFLACLVLRCEDRLYDGLIDGLVAWRELDIEERLECNCCVPSRLRLRHLLVLVQGLLL